MANPSRVVLLTGAAGGIGRVMTQALLAEGHRIVAVDRSEGGLEQLKTACGPEAPVAYVHADLGTEAGCQQAVDAAHERFRHVDALINNAGIGMSSIRPDGEAKHPGIEELSAEVYDRFLAVFVRAPAALAHAVLPMMRQRSYGRIVNNTTSYLTMLRVQPYGAAKAALESMSAVWATELKDSPITVNVLVPGGPTDTPMISDASGWPRDKMLRPRIMAAPIRWLISDAANGFTGQRITAARWDVNLPDAEAVKKATRAIGWPELSSDAVWPTGWNAPSK